VVREREREGKQSRDDCRRISNVTTAGGLVRLATWKTTGSFLRLRLVLRAVECAEEDWLSLWLASMKYNIYIQKENRCGVDCSSMK
jgi:hypothetical protein